MSLADYQQKVYDIARADGLNDVQAKIITAQATHESGNFASPLFNDDNNAFGMIVPHVRSKKYITGPSARHKNEQGAPYASYTSLDNSVHDLVLGLLAYDHIDWSNINSPEDYLQFLEDKSYFTGNQDDYLADVKRIMSEVTATLTSGPGLAGIAVLAIVVITSYFMFKH